MHYFLLCFLYSWHFSTWDIIYGGEIIIFKWGSIRATWKGHRVSFDERDMSWKKPASIAVNCSGNRCGLSLAFRSRVALFSSNYNRWAATWLIILSIVPRLLSLVLKSHNFRHPRSARISTLESQMNKLVSQGLNNSIMSRLAWARVPLSNELIKFNMAEMSTCFCASPLSEAGGPSNVHEQLPSNIWWIHLIVRHGLQLNEDRWTAYQWLKSDFSPDWKWLIVRNLSKH